MNRLSCGQKIMLKKGRKQWELNVPVPLGGRVSYPAGDERRKMKQEETNQTKGRRTDVEWTIRPDGNNFSSQRGMGRVDKKRIVCGHAVKQQSTLKPLNNNTTSLQDFVRKRASRALTGQSAITQSKRTNCHHHLLDTKKMSTRFSTSTEEDIWIPCRYIVSEESIHWHSSERQCGDGGCMGGFYDVTTGAVVLQRTLEELHLVPKPTSSPSCGGHRVWTVCFQSCHPSAPQEGHWDPTWIPHHDMIPFFVGNRQGGLEDEVLWLIPADSDVPFCVQSYGGDVISCRFIEKRARTEEEMRKEHRVLPLPLPSASYETSPQAEALVEYPTITSSRLRDTFSCVYYELTHIHSCEGVEALEGALRSCICLMVGDLSACTSAQGVREVHRRRRAEWSEIVSRDCYMLVKELCHLMVYDDDAADKEGVTAHGRGDVAVKCLLVLVHLCPVEVKGYLSRDQSIKGEAARMEAAFCMCCGCRRGGTLDKMLEVEGLGSMVGRCSLEQFVSPFATILEKLLGETNSLISDYVKLHFSSPSAKGSAVNDACIVSRQEWVANELVSLSSHASLLLSVFTASTNLESSSRSPAHSPECLYCNCCCLHCRKGQEDALGSPDLATGGPATSGEKALTVLQWALEVGAKTSTLPAPVDSFSHEIYGTLIQVSRVLCFSCTPLYVVIREWLAPLIDSSNPNCRDDTTKETSQDFRDAVMRSQCRCVGIGCRFFLNAGRGDSDVFGNRGDGDVVLAGSALCTLSLAVSSVLALVQSDSINVARLLPEQERWEMMQQCLQFIYQAHFEKFLQDFFFPSLSSVLETSLLILRLLDVLLFDSGGEGRALFVRSNEAREEVLAALEGCLESSEDFRERMGILMEGENALMSAQAVPSLTPAAPTFALTSSKAGEGGKCNSPPPPYAEILSVYSSSLIALLSKCYT